MSAATGTRGPSSARASPAVLGRRHVGRDAEGRQHALGVVARGARQRHFGHALALEPGEQHARRDLGARDRNLERHAAQGAAADDERRQRITRRGRSALRPCGAVDRRCDATGRRWRDASPARTERNGCAASTPARSLSVVPLLPQSSTPSGSRSAPPVPISRHAVAVGAHLEADGARAGERRLTVARRDWDARITRPAAREQREQDGAMGNRLVAGREDGAP